MSRMWKELSQRFRKTSFPATNMADVLFELTADKESSDSLIEKAGLRYVDGLSLEKAEAEVFLLNFSAMYVALFRYTNEFGWPLEKMNSMYAEYLEHVKGIARRLGARGEQELLPIIEARLSRYNKIHDEWRQAHDQGRGHDQSFAIGKAFFDFCDARCSNFITLGLMGNRFFAVITTTISTFKDYTLV